MSLIDALLLDPAPFHVWIAHRTDGVKGSGTESDPFDGSARAVFDARLSELPANTQLHLGPSPRDSNNQPIPFQTQGSTAWQPKAGLKIVGSGIDVTVIQLVNAASGQNFAVAHPLDAAHKVDDFEISDLTIDCNLAEASSSSSCGAIRVMGKHARIRRVKAVHFGSKDSGTPCYVFSVITGAPGPDNTVLEAHNAGIDRCIAVEPGAGTVGVVTAFNVGGQDDLSFTKESLAKSPYIRDCFADFGITTPRVSSPKFRGLSMGWCLGGVIEGNHIQNADIAGPYQENHSVRDLIVRNNFFRNVGQGILLSLGQLESNLLSGSASLTVAAGVATVSGGGLNVSSLLAADRVLIDTSSPAFDGIHQVPSIQSSGTVQFTFVTNLSGSLSVTSVQRLLGIGRAVIEGNVFELNPDLDGAASAIIIQDNNTGGSPFFEGPEYVHGDIFIRDNKIRYVDGLPSEVDAATQILVQGAKNLRVQKNILETAADDAFKDERCGRLAYFDNRTPAGALVTVESGAPTDFHETFELPAEDAFVMACFRAV